MNNWYYIFFLPPPPPTVIRPGNKAQLDATSGVSAFTGVHARAVTYFNSTGGVRARPKTAKIAKAGLRSISTAVGAPQVRRAAPALTEDCAFVFPFNRWNWPGAIISVTQGAEIGPYVAANTQLQQRSKVVRATMSGGSIRLHADLKAPYRINSVCIVSHNMTSAATFRVRISNDAAMGNVKYDSGTLPVWEPSFTHSGLFEEETLSDGTPNNTMIEMLRYCGENPRTVRWIVFDEVNAGHVWIDATDAANADGFIEIAYVYVGLCIRAHPDQIYGWGISPVSYARTRRSASGSIWTDVLYRQVVATATFASQPNDVTIGFWNLLGQYLGKKREFIIAFQPSDSPAKKFWYTIYGRFRQTPQLDGLSGGTYNVQLEVEELPG